MLSAFFMQPDRNRHQGGTRTGAGTGRAAHGAQTPSLPRAVREARLRPRCACDTLQPTRPGDWAHRARRLDGPERRSPAGNRRKKTIPPAAVLTAIPEADRCQSLKPVRAPIRAGIDIGQIRGYILAAPGGCSADHIKDNSAMLHPDNLRRSLYSPILFTFFLCFNII